LENPLAIVNAELPEESGSSGGASSRFHWD
jgi:hypothetical protein